MAIIYISVASKQITVSTIEILGQLPMLWQVLTIFAGLQMTLTVSFYLFKYFNHVHNHVHFLRKQKFQLNSTTLRSANFLGLWAYCKQRSFFVI